MVRVKRGTIAHARHKKILKKSKGYYGARSRTYRSAFQAVMRAGQNAYSSRRKKKRYFRKLWIIRINAEARKHGISYSQLIHNMKKSCIEINRKILSDIAIIDNDSFSKLIKEMKNLSPDS